MTMTLNRGLLSTLLTVFIGVVGTGSTGLGQTAQTSFEPRLSRTTHTENAIIGFDFSRDVPSDNLFGDNTDPKNTYRFFSVKAVVEMDRNSNQARYIDFEVVPFGGYTFDRKSGFSMPIAVGLVQVHRDQDVGVKSRLRLTAFRFEPQYHTKTFATSWIGLRGYIGAVAQAIEIGEIETTDGLRDTDLLGGILNANMGLKGGFETTTSAVKFRLDARGLLIGMGVSDFYQRFNTKATLNLFERVHLFAERRDRAYMLNQVILNIPKDSKLYENTLRAADWNVGVSLPFGKSPKK
jgi:hypothetical protein